jgi:predicted MPP superfamily phosphohydrolase
MPPAAAYPRRRWATLAACLTLALGLCGYVFLLGPHHIEVTHHRLRAQSADKGLRLVQLTDLHLDRFGPDEKRWVAMVQALSPDVIVISGDSIEHSRQLPALNALLQALAPTPTYVTPGNWEHWSGVDFQALKRHVEARQGAHFLMNERVTLTQEGRAWQFVGLDDFTAGAPDLALLKPAESGVPQILVQHSPGFFDQPAVRDRMRSQRYALCLSGHTHGGQVALGSWAPWRPAGSGRYTAGFYDVPGCRLYVSRGLGTSILPIRLGARPEIAVFEL